MVNIAILIPVKIVASVKKVCKDQFASAGDLLGSFAQLMLMNVFTKILVITAGRVLILLEALLVFVRVTPLDFIAMTLLMYQCFLESMLLLLKKLLE